MADSKKLPVNRRVEEPPRMRLTERDKQIIKTVWDYRFILSEQIGWLHFAQIEKDRTRKAAVNRRLRRLYQHEYLQRVWLLDEDWKTVKNTPSIYCLDEKGAKLLVSELGVPLEKMYWHPERNKVKTDFLAHYLKMSEFRLVATLAARERGGEIEWTPEWELRALEEKVEDAKTGKKHKFEPDGYFTFTDKETGKKARFFVEVDMGTVTNKTYARKVRLYTRYRTSGAYEKRYKSRTLRVLTATTSPARLRNLKRATEEAGGRSLFHLTTFDLLTPEKIFDEPAWWVAGQSEPVALL